VYLCVLGIKTIFSNILQHTYVCTVCSKCNTEQKRPKSLWWMKKWMEKWRSVGSYKCLFIWWFVCVIWKQNNILRIYIIVLNVKFHFALELRGFADCVSVFRFVCRVLRVWGTLAGNVCKQSRKNVTVYLMHY